MKSKNFRNLFLYVLAIFFVFSLFGVGVKTVDAACMGSANGRTYAYNATSYSPYSQCGSGYYSTNSTFPSQGGSVSWSCRNQIGQLACSGGSASRASAPVNGSCGSSANSCSAGSLSYSPNDTSTQYLWTCNGSNGGSSASCAKYKPINGACLSTHYNCDAGTSSKNISYSTYWSWTCDGLYGGSGANCTQSKPVNGVCGSSNGTSSYFAPEYGLCSVGSASGVSGSGPWSWSCSGSNGGTSASCSANKKVDGGWTSWSPTYSSCGITYTQTRSCTNPSPQNGGASCSGSSTQSVTNSPCPINGGWSAWSPVNNSCGLTYTQTRSCNNPTPAYGGSYCVGSSSQTITNSPCPVNGSCAATHYNCSVGSSQNNTDGQYAWSWSCAGSNGGTTASCTQNKPSGTLTASPSSCSISAGSSSCSVNLTWSTNNPQGTSAITASGMTSVNGNSGSQSFTVPYNGRTFYLYNNAMLLAQVTVPSSCGANTTWNGSTACVLNSYTVSASAGTGGSISPSSRSVSHGSTTTFTATPSSGYTLSSAGGTCGANVSGNTITTGAITSNCTVFANFTRNPINGSCAPTHYNCSSPAGSINNSNANLDYFTWTCPGSYNGTNASCSEAKPLATVDLKVDPDSGGPLSAGYGPYTVYEGTNVRVQWSYNADNCNATNWTGLSGASSGSTGEVVNNSVTYSLTCRYSYGRDVTRSVTVNTIRRPMTGSLTPSSSSCVIASGASTCNVNLNWTVNYPRATWTLIYFDNQAVGESSPYQVSSSTADNISGTKSAVVSYPNRTFSLRNNGVELGVTTVTSSCVSGTTRVGGVCTPPTGSISAVPSSCNISAGSNTCNVSLSWSTTNPPSGSPSAVTSNYPSPGTVVATGNNGTDVSVTVPYSSRTFYLYNNGVLLRQITASSSCTTNTQWNGSTACVWNSYNITASSGPHGTVTPSGTSSVTHGSNKTYTITPDSNYKIANVSVDGVPFGTSGTYTFSNVTASHTINATFTAQTCSNGATNFPACTINSSGACLNGANNPPTCSTFSTIPTVTTSTVSNIAQTTATGGGNVTSNGGATVTVSGLVWSTSVNPTTANSKTTNGWAIGGPWSSNMTGLTAGTTYHVRAYATNSVGTAYGVDRTFTTSPYTCANGATNYPTCTTNSSGSCLNGANNPPTCSTFSMPDLTASTPTPTTASTNVAQTFSSSISNIGNATASGTITHLFQFDSDSNHNNGITTYTDTTSAIPAGGNSSVTHSHTFSSSGTHYVRVCADNNASFVGTITESNEGNNCSTWASVTVTNVPVPVVTLTANPTSGTVNVVNPTLTWSATNSPTSCTASGDWSGSKAASGTNVSQGVLTTVKTYTYTLVCANIGGNSSSVSATVAVSAPAVPTASLTANPNPVDYNSHSTLSWSSTNATTCTAYGPWSNSGTLSGSGWTDNLTSETTFQFQCSNASGQTSPMQSVTVSVGSAPANGSCAATHNNCNYPVGGAINISEDASSYTWTCPGTNGGTNDLCSESKSVCVPGQGNPCISGLNSCGEYNSGTIQCDGSCSAVTPPESSCVAQTCQDPNATNLNGPLPCTYPPSNVCQDPAATNFNGTLPCAYPPSGSCPNGATNPPLCTTDGGDDTCPTGYSGTYPNCVGPGGGICPVGYSGTYPDCVGFGGGICPVGYTGAYPDCTGPVGGICPPTYTGTYPNCVGPIGGGSYCLDGAMNPPECNRFRKQPIFIEN